MSSVLGRRQLLGSLIGSLPILGACETTRAQRASNESGANSSEAPSSSLPVQPSQTPERTGVLVIGAGVAGLSAAKELVAAGEKVIVLEGRDLIGGRVFTDRSWSDCPIDAGASWIQGTRGNPLFDMVQKAGVRTVQTSGDSNTVFRSDGKVVDDAAEDVIEGRYKKIMQSIERQRQHRQKSKLPDISLEEAIASVRSSARQSPAVRAEDDYSINTNIEHEYAGDCSDLSLYYFDAAGDFGGRDVMFPDGYDVVPRELARGLDVRLSHVVRHIEYNSRRVTCRTSNGEFYADRAVVTVPLGVLKQKVITFAPELPLTKQQAIERLGMGVLDKVYLRFSSAFWTDKVDSDLLNYISDEKGAWGETVNLKRTFGVPALLFFNAGQFARKVESYGDEKIVGEAMKVLRNIFGSKTPNPTHSKIFRWAADPFSFGSYSFLAKGSTPKDQDSLFAPVDDRLFFAGEATSKDHPATVHGALLSGRRVAAKMVGVR